MVILFNINLTLEKVIRDDTIQKRTEGQLPVSFIDFVSLYCQYMIQYILYGFIKQKYNIHSNKSRMFNIHIFMCYLSCG